MHFFFIFFFLESDLKWKKSLKILQEHTMIIKKYLSCGRTASLGDFSRFWHSYFEKQFFLGKSAFLNVNYSTKNNK